MQTITKAIAATIAATMLAIPAAAFADDTLPKPLPRPDRDDPAIITTAGDYTADQAAANQATYLALQDYTDQMLDTYNRAVDSRDDTIATMMTQLFQRDIDCANALNAKQATIVALGDQVTTLQAKVAHKDATIKRLRAIIRDLRDND